MFDSPSNVMFVLASSSCTVWLVSTARFSVHILLLHHYRSDLAHTSDRCSSVIELYLSEIGAKNYNKKND